MDWYSKQAEIAQFLVASSFVEAAYVGVELRQKENEYKPVYKEGNGFEWVGTNDAEMPYAYIRITEKIAFKVLEKLTPDMFLYDVSAKMRLVFWCRASWESVFNSLMNFVAFRDLEVLSITHDSKELWEIEQKGVPFKTIPNDISYFAIDFSYSEMVSNRDCGGKLLQCTQKDKYKFTLDFFNEIDLGDINLCDIAAIEFKTSYSDSMYRFVLYFDNAIQSYEDQYFTGQEVAIDLSRFVLNENKAYKVKVFSFNNFGEQLFACLTFKTKYEI